MAVSLIQAAVAIAAALVAFAPSLLSLASGIPADPSTGELLLAPLFSLVLAALIWLRKSAPEPEIHDRYLDYILGLAGLGIACAVMFFFPGSLSLFFWSWRLDMLALPIFLAGAIFLLCGSRALWRYRLPLGFLLLGWPLPYAAAHLTGGFQAAQLVILAVAGGLAMLSLVRNQPRPPTVRPATTTVTAPKRVIAGLLVVSGAALVLISDSHISSALRLLHADGTPRLGGDLRLPASLHGLPRLATADASSLPTWAPPAHQSLFQYGSQPATTVDLIEPPDARDLDLLPGSIAALQGYVLDRGQAVDLGAAVEGRLETYSQPDGGASLEVVWWEWPVRSGAGVLRQRVIVERTLPPGAAADTDQLVGFARDLVASKAPVSGSEPTP